MNQWSNPRGLPPARRIVAVAAMAGLIGALALLAIHAVNRSPTALGSASGQPAAPPSATSPVQLSAPRKIYWGASIQTPQGQAPWNMSLVSSFAGAAGKNLSLISWGSPFYSSPYCAGDCGFETAQFNSVRGYGAIPVFSWGPGWSRNVDARIAAGADDSYLTQWAQTAKAWGHPLFLRFAWEMNGDWFPWGTGASGVSTEGNTPATYVAMWRHVHDIFTRVGATNVSWVWCPNVSASTTFQALSELYPGDAYVDWTCLDGYNGNNPWLSFGDLYGPSYYQLVSFAPNKPMMIGEVSSTEAGGSKAKWIAGMFTTLPTLFPNVRGLIWYQTDAPGPGGHSDWSIESSPSAAQAFRGGITSSGFASNTYSYLARNPIPPPS